MLSSLLWQQGKSIVSPHGVLRMLNYFYHVPFDATAETKNTIFADGKAVVETEFIGKHIREFAGIAARNKHVRVPLRRERRCFGVIWAAGT